MRKLTQYIAVLVLGIVMLSSCAEMKWISSPYTDVDKLTMLREGMSTRTVSSSLGIPPSDIYHSDDENSTVLVYNYRLLDRRMKYSENSDKHYESSQKAGDAYFNEERAAYLLFKDNKFKSMVTTIGREMSDYLLVKNNTIQAIAEKNLTYFFTRNETGRPDTSYYVLIDLKGKLFKAGQDEFIYMDGNKVHLMPRMGLEELISEDGKVNRSEAVLEVIDHYPEYYNTGGRRRDVNVVEDKKGLFNLGGEKPQSSSSPVKTSGSGFNPDGPWLVYGKTFKRKVSPGAAWALSYLVPGTGQFYTKNYIGGGIAAGVHIISLSMVGATASSGLGSGGGARIAAFSIGVSTLITNWMVAQFGALKRAKNINREIEAQQGGNYGLKLGNTDSYLTVGPSKHTLGGGFQLNF